MEYKREKPPRRGSLVCGKGEAAAQWGLGFAKSCAEQCTDTRLANEVTLRNDESQQQERERNSFRDGRKRQR